MYQIQMLIFGSLAVNSTFFFLPLATLWYFCFIFKVALLLNYSDVTESVKWTQVITSKTVDQQIYLNYLFNFFMTVLALEYKIMT